MEQDQVTLATRAENHRNGSGHWSTIIQLPPAIGYVGGSFRAYFTKPQRSEFVKHFREN
jgi:hypothetical protein